MGTPFRMPNVIIMFYVFYYCFASYNFVNICIYDCYCCWCCCHFISKVSKVNCSRKIQQRYTNGDLDTQINIKCDEKYQQHNKTFCNGIFGISFDCVRYGFFIHKKNYCTLITIFKCPYLHVNFMNRCIHRKSHKQITCACV